MSWARANWKPSKQPYKLTKIALAISSRYESWLIQDTFSTGSYDMKKVGTESMQTHSSLHHLWRPVTALKSYLVRRRRLFSPPSVRRYDRLYDILTKLSIWKHSWITTGDPAGPRRNAVGGLYADRPLSNRSHIWCLLRRKHRTGLLSRVVKFSACLHFSLMRCWVNCHSAGQTRALNSHSHGAAGLSRCCKTCLLFFYHICNVVCRGSFPISAADTWGCSWPGGHR